MPTPALNAADTTWMLISTALVLLMVPGLALFYSGMVRAKNILATMMQTMASLALGGMVWALVGYAIAFGDDVGGLGVIGWSPSFVALHGVKSGDLWPGTGVPVYVHAMFQGMFASLTPALISGALAERLRFSRWCIFVVVWSLVVYAPLAHMVWHPQGWLFELGALDFAGGTVVHIAAGISALVAAKMVRVRNGWPERPIHPSSAANTLLGAGLLWVGWFGFNGGSALAASPAAGLALTVTHIAACAGAVAWIAMEWRSVGKPSAIGFASGAVAGLVGITPAAGFVGPAAAMAIGCVAALGCFAVVTRKARWGLDDALDAFGVHGVGGAIGAVLTGVLADKGFYDGPGGWLADGNLGQVGVQALSVLATVAYAAPWTALLVVLLGRDGVVVSLRDEEFGLDGALHGERAWDLAEDAVTALHVTPRAASRPPQIVALQVALHGVEPAAVDRRWAELCALPAGSAPEALLALLPKVTRVRDGHVRLVDADATWAADQLQALFPDARPSLAGEPSIHRSPLQVAQPA